MCKPKKCFLTVSRYNDSRAFVDIYSSFIWTYSFRLCDTNDVIRKRKTHLDPSGCVWVELPEPLPATERPETKQNKTHFLKLKNLPTADTPPLLIMTYFDAFLLYFILYRQSVFTVLKQSSSTAPQCDFLFFLASIHLVNVQLLVQILYVSK